MTCARVWKFICICLVVFVFKVPSVVVRLIDVIEFDKTYY